jgi:hypothetical protein
MSEIKMNLYEDWIETVKEIFRGSGFPFEPGTPHEVIGQTYYRQSADTDEEAARLNAENERRLREMERTIRDHFASVIEPDIRKRTGYKGDRFEFKWVYMQGENIVELNSEYRIPLG